MELEKIISISGKPGLFKLVSQLRSGFIVEDISTGKKSNITNSSQVSLLENIAMFTFEKEIPLFEVLEKIANKESFKETINHKSSETELVKFMEGILPDYDTERVYVSNIKKLVQWYNILRSSGYITKEAFETRKEAQKEQEVEAE